MKSRARIEISWNKDNHKDIWLIKYTPNGKMLIGKPAEIEFQEFDEGSILPKPTLTLDGDMCDAIADALFGKGQVAAMKQHISDLKEIILNK